MQKRITKINEMKDRIDRLVLDVKVGLSQKAAAIKFSTGVNSDEMEDSESLL